MIWTLGSSKMCEKCLEQLLGDGIGLDSSPNGCFQKWGYPKWMVKIMENPIKVDDLGVLFSETSKY